MPSAMLVQAAPPVTAPAIPAGITRDEKPWSADTGRALVAVAAVVLVIMVGVGIVFDLETLLTWIMAVDCEIVIPLATVTLIRAVRPRWARSVAAGTTLGTVMA